MWAYIFNGIDMDTNLLGLVQVYTGDGKGKTTAALGQALRASGHGYNIIVIQFMKGRNYGELISTSKIKNFKIMQFGSDEFVYKDKLKKKDIMLAKKGLKYAQKALICGKWDIVILDEINIAVDYGLVPLNQILKLIKKKPKNIELIMTGRNAPNEFINLADLVTEMKEITHPYKKGIICRKGIDW